MKYSEIARNRLSFDPSPRRGEEEILGNVVCNTIRRTRQPWVVNLRLATIVMQVDRHANNDREAWMSATTVAYEALQRGIATGQYPPGSWLREGDVAATVGVSRTPVREALNRLQSEGFVKILRNRGAVVVGWTAKDLDDIFDLRVMLEGYGARKAAQSPSAVDFPALYAMCDEMDQLLAQESPRDPDRLSQLCVDFHTSIHLATGNRQLLSFLPVLIGMPLVREAFHYHTDADLERAFAQHRELLEALEVGDGDWAEGIMRAHLRAGRRSLRPMEREPLEDDIDESTPEAS
ncbi:MAG: GntR family transcriptional regulator [Haloechinothrix sp.]